MQKLIIKTVKLNIIYLIRDYQKCHILNDSGIIYAIRNIKKIRLQ